MDLPERIRKLTPGERKVLRLVAESMSTREIAELLALSEKTVENRRCGIVQKLDLRGTRGLALFAYTHRSLL
jgi:DNA-binding NarL/FixJ family response regulator